MRILIAVVVGVLLASGASVAIVQTATAKPDAGPPKPLYVYGSG